MPDTPPSLTPQDALVALMIAVSFSDEAIRTTELVAIQRIVNHLPIFGGYDADRLRTVAQTVFDLMEEEDGLDALFGLIRDALPERLFETAYALACDMVAADGQAARRGASDAGGGAARVADRPPSRRRHRMGRPRAPHAALTPAQPARAVQPSINRDCRIRARFAQATAPGGSSRCSTGTASRRGTSAA